MTSHHSWGRSRRIPSENEKSQSPAGPGLCGIGPLVSGPGTCLLAITLGGSEYSPTGHQPEVVVGGLSWGIVCASHVLRLWI